MYRVLESRVPVMVRKFDARQPDFETGFAAFLAEDRGTGHDVASIVRKILDDVEASGGLAVADYTAKFDELQVNPTTLQSDNVDLHALAADCPADLREAIDFAHDRIAAYHTARRTTASPIQQVSSLAGAGPRSQALASMYPAVARVIHLPC